MAITPRASDFKENEYGSVFHSNLLVVLIKPTEGTLFYLLQGES